VSALAGKVALVTGSSRGVVLDVAGGAVMV